MAQTFTPTPVITRTPIDEIGSLLDISRITGEDLVSYSERIYDTYANRGASTYEGLINAINRELGLTRKDAFTVSIRPIGIGLLTDPNIAVTSTTLTNSISFSNLIDGTNVVAVGSVLTDNIQSWPESSLRGFALKVAGHTYNVQDNTSTTLTIDGDMSGLIGETYQLEVDWEDNILIGLGLRLGNHLFRIAENTSNIIRIESGDLLQANATEYRITAYNPKVEVTGAKIDLYKEYVTSDNFQLECRIDLRDDVQFHWQIVDKINELTYFEAELVAPVKDEIFSYTLKKQSSEHIVIREIVPASKFFKLENYPIREGSVRFSESNIFLREVDLDDVSQAAGNYNINYDQGIVTARSNPSGSKTVSYRWNEFPFTVVSSPVVVNALADKDTQEFLFSQIEMRVYDNINEKFLSGQPKADMIESVAELLAVKPMNWGE